ncbi:nucleotidyl transferase AbiEii/AbiGii toxin family protein [Corynebacterium diphtheriae]|uniref:nucleotidyl transferase AbiEii/AbiGii toxin family protein n=1 Tax=Corynebacterium diphtheriae TaxID=1717 RepID=UPI000A631643|nr:nucleotidyl transferase AbiEii/AbiGii toxin family protein [Corynebacterium diphtheriae]CAB1011735.1 hypothetical protein FRC0537_01067 [Corynebacterium diphtheriae]
MDDIKRVVTALSSVVSTEKIMLVGARCRDINQKNIVGGEASRATKDIDFALALEDWELFRALKQRFPSTTNAWQSVLVEGITLDIIPFGELEEPLGEVSSGYTHKLNVRGMQEVFEHAQFLQLGDGLTIRMPTVSGLAALKMFAWLDRGRETYKDAQDLALILEWVAKDDNALWERVDEIPEKYWGELRNMAGFLLGSDINKILSVQSRDALLAGWKNVDDQAVERCVWRLEIPSKNAPQIEVRYAQIMAVLEGICGA